MVSKRKLFRQWLPIYSGINYIGIGIGIDKGIGIGIGKMYDKNSKRPERTEM